MDVVVGLGVDVDVGVDVCVGVALTVGGAGGVSPGVDEGVPVVVDVFAGEDVD